MHLRALTLGFSTLGVLACAYWLVPSARSNSASPSASPTLTPSPTPSPSSTPEPRCFSLEQKANKPLLPPEPRGPDSPSHGTREIPWKSIKVDYAWTEGEIEKPAIQIFQSLLNPRVLRDKEDTKIEVSELTPGIHWKHLQQTITIKPVFFLKLRWQEDWLFQVLKGTHEAPTEALVSYEKFEGTSHIQHLCGCIHIRALGKNRSKVYVYEELNAAQRDSEDTLKGVRATLENLKKDKVEVIERGDTSKSKESP